jgi:cytochrome c biogenesis protein CcmG, thiol:disulfide interchange protein DsbE
MSRFVLPLVIFLVLVVFLAMGLRPGRDPSALPSTLIGKTAPDFHLAQLHEPDKTFSPQEMKGKVWLLNVWASWCFSCREEHPVLLEVQRSGIVPIYGLNTKNERDEALAWLKELGNPYVLSAADIDGRVGIDYGVSGAPETFLIDRDGIVRFKQVGPIDRDLWSEKILPLVQQLNK